MKLRIDTYKEWGGIICLTTALAVSGCSESIYRDNIHASLTSRYLCVTPDGLSFNAVASSEQVDVMAPQTNWIVDNSADWVKFSHSSGIDYQTVTVSVTDNPKGDEKRVAIAYFKANEPDWDYKTPVTITQYAATPFINVESSLYVDGKASTVVLPVSANVEWTSSCAASWISAEPSEDLKSLTISLSENNWGYDRSEIIYLKASKVNKTVSLLIHQQAPNISAQTNSLSFPNKGGAYELTIESDASWMAYTSSGWLDVSPSSGNSGSSTLVVSATENASIDSRKGYVYLKIGSQDILSIPVDQEALYLNVNTASLDFDSYSGSKDVAITSNTDWQVTASNDWITTTPESKGNGDTAASVGVTEDASIYSRSGKVSFSLQGYSLSKEVKVNQSGKSITLSENDLSFSDVASTQTVEITTDGEWSVSTGNDWISVSPQSGYGDAILSVSVPENMGQTARNGSLTVTMAESSNVINVLQTGKYFKVENGDLTMSSRGGKINVSISTNDTWQVTTLDEADWVSFSTNQGKGNIDLDIILADNPSLNSRSATVEFTTTSGYVISLDVEQAARYLTLSGTGYYYYYNAFTSEPISIDTDGDYEVLQTGDWYTVERTDNVLTISAPQNDTDDFRYGKLEVKLDNLVDGEKSVTIDVAQSPKNSKFDYSEYDKDSNWDTVNGTVIIFKGSYDKDQQWESTGRDVTITVVGYRKENNWDTVNSSVSMGKGDYQDDKKHDYQDQSSTSMNKDKYDDDVQFDKQSQSNSLDKSGYSTDKDFDKE